MCASLSACSLFVTLDGLTGGDSSDAAPADASANDVEPSDGGAGDVVSITDAGGDAFCANDAVFCDDFERDGDVQGSWTSMQTSLGALSIGARSGGGRALVATTQASGGLALLRKDFSSAMTTGRVSFDIQLPAGGPGTFYSLELSLGPSTQSLQRSIDVGQRTGATVIYDQLTELDGGYLTGGQTFVSSIADGTWHHLDVFTSLAGSGAPTASVNVDGVQAVAPFSIYADFTPANPYIEMGIAYASSGTGATSVQIDNVEVAF